MASSQALTASSQAVPTSFKRASGLIVQVLLVEGLRAFSVGESLT